MSTVVPPIVAQPTGPAAGTIQPFERCQVREVADLFTRVFLHREEPADDAVCRRFETIFFEHPWQGAAVSPSMTCLGDDGRVVGFFGAHPRFMTLAGQSLSAVAVGQFMVDPGQRGRGVGLALARAIVAGPQSVTFTTSAAVSSARIFRRAGFWTPPFSGLRWHKSLRLPGRLARLPARGRIRRSLVSATSGLAARRLRQSIRGWRCRMLDGADDWLALRAACDVVDLCGVMSPAQAAWVWEALGHGHPRHRLRVTAIEDDAAVIQAWVVDRVSPNGDAKVLEFISRSDDCVAALTRYLTTAASEGLNSVRGGCHTPALAVAAAECGARLGCAPPATALHAADPTVRQALLNGTAVLSELDGESWLRFQG